MLCGEQGLTPTTNLFHRCYAIHNSGSKKGCFYFGNRGKNVPNLEVDAPMSIKEWKHNFFFVSAEDFPRGFWWRPPVSAKDPTPGKHDEEGFRKLLGSGLRINCWDYLEAVLVNGGISRALIGPSHPPFFSIRLQKHCILSFFTLYCFISFDSY